MAGTNKNSGLTLTGTGSDLGAVLDGLVNSLAVQSQSGDSQAQLASQLAQLAGVSQTQADALSENTKALVENTVAKAGSSGSSSGTGVLGTVAKVFTSGLGLTSVVSGLSHLFGGGGAKPTQTVLTQYVAPPSIQFDGSISRSGDSEAAGTTVVLPTLWSGEGSSSTQAVATAAPSAAQSESRRAAAAAQITVQVQAMDSRSFLDHRDEIAQAVREAMLNSHALNDVVNDL